MPLTVGGGVRKLDDVRKLLEAGADKVSINTAAVKDRDFVRAAAEKFGAQCIVVAIDAKRVAAGKARGPRFEIFTHGGREPTGIEATGYAREVVALGAGEILLTSMDRDGTKQGFDLELTRAVADAVSGAGDRKRRGRHASSIWSRACARAMPQPCSQPRSSTMVNAPSARPSASWRLPACRSGSIEKSVPRGIAACQKGTVPSLS